MAADIQNNANPPKVVALGLQPVAVSGPGLQVEEMNATAPWQSQGICRVAFRISPASNSLARVIVGNKNSSFQTVYAGSEEQLRKLEQAGGRIETILPQLQVLAPRTQLRTLQQANLGERGNRAKTFQGFSPYAQRLGAHWALLVIECAPHVDQAGVPAVGTSFVRAFGHVAPDAQQP